jgi:hypothetical protein
MSHKISRAALWMAPVLLLALFPLRLSGQETAANNSKAEQSVTGCLQKGDEPGGFVLAGEDGKTWELSSKTVKLAEHVGHKVKVTGSSVQESKANEDQKEKNEKKESAGKEYADLKVSSLEMVSDSCK